MNFNNIFSSLEKKDKYEDKVLFYIKDIIALHTNCFIENNDTLRIWVYEWLNDKKMKSYSKYTKVISLIKLLEEDEKEVSDFIEFYKQKKRKKITNNAIGKSIKINGDNKIISNIIIQKEKNKIDICFSDNKVISISNITELEKVLIVNEKIRKEQK